ncbi:MAG: sulfite exporter TauE/SafE family protein [Candidatus Methanoperedens sp.]|nr:sulfite exporter TauE/SafE family protein [Candidatus Methanoperedens sp.]
MIFDWAGLDILTAIPIALLMNMLSTASSSVTYLKQRLVDTKAAIPIILTSIPGALAGAYIARRMDPVFIVLLLSIVLFIAGLRILLYNSIGFSVRLGEKEKMLLCGGSGFFIGMVSSIVGIGGGIFIVPLLLVLGYETKKATATSTFVIVFISLAGFLGHMIQGVKGVDNMEISLLNLLLFAGAATVIGAQVGSRLIFNRISGKKIEQIFALVLLLVGIKLIYGLY